MDSFSQRFFKKSSTWIIISTFTGLFLLVLFGLQSDSDLTVAAQGQDGTGDVTITGELKQWHNVVLSLEGPWVAETDTPNPFTDYRMDVTFTNGSLTYVVPGYFAADGNAAETSATEGNIWRAHLSPDLTGTWNYSITFKSGEDVAVTDVGAAVAPYDGVNGSFTIAATDKSGDDLRGKGRLTYVGERYLQFAGSEEYFIKVGADAPENFLNYTEFDNTYNDSGTDYTKDWGPHISDWNNGDPTWQNGKGRGIIGAVNYLADQGLNVFSFLTYNVGGDSRDVWPFIDPDERFRYDASKLDQWAIVFEHATSKGMYLHFKTQETENDNEGAALDGGDVDIERQLYYRELMARFGHNLALNWNLGEENTQNETQRKEMAAYFAENDPYQHLVVLHTYPNQQDQVYRPLLGSASDLTGASLQNDWSQVHARTLQWIEESAAAGKQWVVANDEQGNAQNGIPPDPGWPGYGNGGPSRDELRHEVLWGNLMAGGAGIEAYFGYGHPESDLTADDFRSRAGWWADNSRALTFFETHLPFWRMTNCNTLIGNQNNNDGNGYCFGSSAEIYAIYLPDGGTKSLDLSGLAAEPYSVQWYDPRNGGALQSGTITQVTAGQTISIGSPPSETSLDWVALVARDDGPALPTPTPNPNATPTPDPSRFAVVSLTLINTDTNQSIKTLVNGETLYLPSLPTSNLNVRADVNNPNFNTGSVQFDLNGQASYQTENVAPYSVFGDSNGDYEAWDLNIGTHSITATPFTGADGSGTAGDSLTISFTISNAMEPTPTLGPITGGSNGSYLPIIANGASVQNTPVDPTATPTMESSTIPNRTPTPTSQASGMSCNDADYADDNGLIVIEMESSQITGDWDFGTSRSDYTGSGYYQWGGSNQYNNPGSGLIEYKIRVETTGTYRFQWRSQIAVGSDSTEHNDSWLRFPDASEFYGLKGNHIVYPADTGQSPTPNGASKDGWFKVYISQLGEWGWQARTSDHDAHDIYVGFDQPGVYTMQISGRSTGHAIDRIVLYHENVSSSDATSLENSETICQP